MFCFILDEPMVGATIPPYHGSFTLHLSIDELSFIAFDLRLVAIIGVLESTFTVSDAIQVLSYVFVSV
jgi:hypothetical protein